MTTQIKSDICPSCHIDREQLKAWLSEGLVYEHYASLSTPYHYGIRLLRSENHQKALSLIEKCDLCKQALRR